MALDVQLKFENAFQQLLVHLATRFINQPVDQIDEALTRALRQIAEFLGSQRASINLFNDDQIHFTPLYHWTPPEDHRVFPFQETIPDSTWFRAVLERGGAITVSNRADLPADSEFPAFLGKYDVEALLAVPLMREGTLIGFVSTSWRTPQKIRPEIADLLRLVGEIFLNTVDRKENETRILKLNEALEERVQERTHELREINEQLQAEIRERTQVEEVLRLGEERYRTVTRLMSDYAFLYGVEPDGALKLEWFTGDSYARVTGYGIDEPREDYQLYYPEDAGLARQDVERTAQGQPSDREYRIVTKAGEIRWLHIRRYPVWDAQHQRVERFYGVARDITERKQVEEALRVSEERYRTVTGLMSDFASLYNVEPDGSLKLVWFTGDSYTRVTGYQVDEQSANFSLYHPDDVAQARQDVERVIQGQPTEREYRILTKGGEERWIFVRRYPLWDASHTRVERFYGVAQDITERKLAEEALRINEERYRMVGQLISDYAFLFDVEPEGVLKVAWATEDSFMRLTGYAVDELDHMRELYLPEDVPLAVRDVELTLQGQPNEGEYRIVTKSGEVRWVYTRRYPVWDGEHKQVVRYYGVAQDITERKQVEQQLAKERTLLQTVVDNVPDGIFVKDRQGRNILVNLADAHFIGADSEKDLIGKTVYDYFSDEPAARVHAEEEALMASGQSVFNQEVSRLNLSGNLQWLLLTKVPLRDSQGQVVGLVGIARDITKRKRIEMEEHEQRVLAEALRDTAAALNSTLDLDEVLDRILTNIGRVAPHDGGVVMLIEEGVARVVRAKGANMPEWVEAAQKVRFPLATTMNLLQVYETQQPLIIPDVRLYPDWVETAPYHWIRSDVSIPIRYGNEVIGFLSCDSAMPDFFTPEMLLGLQAFADQTAIAITNARLYRQAQELAVLQERQRLARDLHDAVTQTMFSASVIAETLARQWERDPEQVRQGLTQLRYLTRGAVAEMRALLLELRPEALDGLSLPHLISQLAEAFSGQTGIVPTVALDGDRPLPPEVKITLYRIAQEAMNNVSKHARASKLDVSLKMNDMVRLEVSDNGRGFLPEQKKAGSLGLKIMRERAEQIGAKLVIDSEPGKTTIITVEWVG